MAITLYDATVAPFLQTLAGVSGFLEKGRAHFTAAGIDLQEIVNTRLIEDMLPLSFQIVSVAHHSQGAIEGVKAGVFSPNVNFAEHDYASLQKLVADAQDYLKGLTREAVNALEQHDTVFQFRDTRMPFTGEGFLLTFSLPNLHFHAATAYDILRMKGVPLGKRDYMGMPRIKT
jgi:hypothetical protein